MSGNMYEYNQAFRTKILRLLLEKDWLVRYGLFIIKPEYFETDQEIELCKVFIDFYKKYSKIPDLADVSILTKKEGSFELAKNVYAIDSNSIDLVSDVVIQFAKEQAAKVAVLEGVDDINKGDISKLIGRLEEALNVGRDLSSIGIDPIIDIDSWLYNYWSDKIKTGLLHLDHALDGGLGFPEIGVILAPPGRGKSMALINIGYNAASIGSGKNVLHISHEMSENQVAKRYAARIMHRFVKRDDDLTQYKEEFLARAYKMIRGSIRVIYGKMTTEDVDKNIQKLIADGFNPDLIIDDYPDLVKNTQRFSERRHELSANFDFFRNLSDKYQCPVWVGSQSTRGSLSKEIITMDDIAEDWGKAQIADVIVALCQTKKEKIEERARLLVVKTRDSDGLFKEIDCKYYPRSQALITVGNTKRDNQESVA